MSEFNSCAHLVNADDFELAQDMYHRIRAEGGDPLQEMMNMQHRIQDRLSEINPWVPKIGDLKTCGEILDWVQAQDDAIADETRELYTALGGMSNGKDASAVFKPWKSKHLEARAKLFSELSAADQLEVAFEAVDMWHFVMCKFLALGLDAEKIFTLYMLKNAENMRRWESGY